MTEGRQGPPAWERVSTERLGDYEIFRVRRDRARSPLDGSEHDFHVAEAPDGVTLVALTPRGEVVLVEQFRHPHREATLETPSGIMEAGEDPVEAGLRELREETGYAGGEARLLGTLALNPSWQTTRVHVVLARGVERTEGKELDDTEDTRVRLVPADRVRELVLRGEVTACVGVAAFGLWAWSPEGAAG